MNPARLLEHFDRISEAPEAVPRLRRFILDLAVRGKLVEQDPRDEPAEELRKRIKLEKAEVLRRGVVRKSKALPSFDVEGLPFDVPHGWAWSQLAEVGFVNPRNDAPDEAPASFAPMSSIPAEYGAVSRPEQRSWGEIKSGFTHFADGDVGLAKITPCFENGKSTAFGGLTSGIGAGTTELHVVRPVLVSAQYVLLFLKSSHFIESGIPRMTGTAGQKRVPTDYFAHSPFPLPPLAEQHRIVAKVDELIALCDRLEAAQSERERRRDRLVAASLKRLSHPADDESFREGARFHLVNLPRLVNNSSHIQALRESTRGLAVRGKLTNGCPSDGPASELLSQIQIEKATLLRAGCGRGVKTPSRAKAEDLPFKLQPGWAAARMSELLLELQTGPFGSTLHQSDYVAGGVPVINPASIKKERLIPVEGMAVGPKTVERLSTFRLRAGDMVMARRGEMGRCAVVSEAEAGWLCGTGSLILRLPTCVFPRFFVTLIGSPFVRAYLGGSAVGATMQNLNQSILLNLVVGLPPLAEQRLIVAKVDELMALSDRLEAQLESVQTGSRRLLDAILAEALAVDRHTPAHVAH